MIKRKLKKCISCEKQTIIFSKGMCRTCSTRKDAGKKLQTKNNIPRQKIGNKNNSLGKRTKKTGELKIFRKIWEERPHACQVCGVSLPVFDHWNYAHCLSKGSFNKFRLLKENIILMCRECHTQYDCGSTINDPKFQWVLELKQKLKQQYYETNILPEMPQEDNTSGIY